MHRFRKKSDAKRIEIPAGFGFPSGSLPDPVPFPSSSSPLPSLPPIGDFRTSLILPELTRRFTVLRSSNGDPVSLDDLRIRFANQRAKGLGNQISEEEEDMLLEALGRIRSQNTTGRDSVKSLNNPKDSVRESDISLAKDGLHQSLFSLPEFTHNPARESGQSISTMSSAGFPESIASGSQSSSFSKRHSNNLFSGSGQGRDIRYMRKTSNRTIGSGRSMLSTTPSEDTNGSTANALIESYAQSPSIRPTTPENSTPSVSVASSPNSSDKTAVSPQAEPKPLFSEPTFKLLEKRLTGTQLSRVSMSLEQVIREIEEEAEDQILVPRSSVANSVNSESAKAFALSTNDVTRNLPLALNDTVSDTPNGHFSDSATERVPSPTLFRTAGSASPTPRVPGYIPGMPRPVTPRDMAMDLDDQRSHSTTPRAASPTSYVHTQPLALSATTLLRRGSNASASSPHSHLDRDPRPGSPLAGLVFSKPVGGTPLADDRRTPTAADYVHTSPSTSQAWTRPSSPLSSSAFQSLGSNSRPGTPSTVTWNLSSRAAGQNVRSLGRNGTLLGHTRNQSSSSSNDIRTSPDSNSSDNSRSSTQSPKPSGSASAPVDDTSKIMWSPGSSQLSSLNRGDSFTSGPIRPTTPVRDFYKSATFDEPLRKAHNIMSPVTSPTTSPYSKQQQSPFHQHQQSNPLLFSTLSNSSHSSLVSAGSSYRSWEDERGFGEGFLDDVLSKDIAWHEIPTAETTAEHSQSGSKHRPSSGNPEHILRQFTGLSKLDLLSIQRKLLEAASTRAKSSESRAPSALRRRRPSTAQSVHSASGIPSRTTSPAPAPQVTVSQSYARSPETTAKMNALLNSMVEGIPRSQIPEPVEPIDIKEDTDGTRTGSSSPFRRNKDLADVIFGDNPPLALSPEPPEHFNTDEPENIERVESPDVQTLNVPDSDEDDDGPVIPMARPPVELEEEETEPVIPFPIPDQVNERPPSPPEEKPLPLPVIPHFDAFDVMRRQVQERTELAMAQLHRSPQQNQKRFPSPVNTTVRRRIHPQDISSPMLVQSSTSVDKIPTVPITSPVQQNITRSPSSKLSFGIKRLRNTLKGKSNAPNGEEVTPWSSDSQSNGFPSPRTPVTFAGSMKGGPLSPGSMTDLHMKVPSSAPPLGSFEKEKKSFGFISRFRRRGPSETSTDGQGSSSLGSSMVSSNSISPVDRATPNSGPPSHPNSVSKGHRPNLTPSNISSPQLNGRFDTALKRTPTSPNIPISPSDPEALRKFLDAAQSLGLPQTAVSDFLAMNSPRSPERTPLTAAFSQSEVDVSRSQQQRDSPPMIAPIERVASPISDHFIETALDRRPSTSQRNYLAAPSKSGTVGSRPLLQGRHPNVESTIIRRTLIFPSANPSTTDLNLTTTTTTGSLARKVSKSYKRVSGTSLQSGRSVHDRVPTPPPPTRAKRFSAEASPPVPSIPTSRWLNQGGTVTPFVFPADTTSPNGKFTSAHESLHDLSTGDRSFGSHTHDHPNESLKNPSLENMPDLESGQALELIEMANGETIWSIVNGLRADDAESLYQNRVSMSSEFSAGGGVGGAHDSDGEQLFFKEHARTSSKTSNGSVSSNVAAKRKTFNAGPAAVQPANRPETKVFYSSSAQIARLIEQLSRGADAGFFNIKPKQSIEQQQQSHIPGHSHSSSLQSETDMQWTVEERLEHMLGAMSSS